MDLAGMKRRELQALCKRHGLPAGGTNVDLVARLDTAVSGAAGTEREEEEEVVGVAARKGCLKRTGRDAAEAKKVTFAVEEGKARRLRSRVIWSPVVARTRRKCAEAGTDSAADDGISAESGADIPVRRSRRNSLSAAEAVEVGEGVAVDRKRKSQEEDEGVAVSAQVGVSSRVTRRSSLSGVAAVLPPEVEKKRGRGKAPDGTKFVAEAQDCEPDVHKSAKVELSARTTRSRSAAPVVTSPIVVENKRRRKTGDAQENLELPMVSDVPTNDAPVTRSLRNRAVQVNNCVVNETHTAKQLESKMQPSRPATRRHQQVASSLEDKDQEQITAPSKQIAAPSKPPLLRRSGRNNSEANNTNSETISLAKDSNIAQPLAHHNANSEDLEKQPAVKEPVTRSTRKSVVSATLEKEKDLVIEEKNPGPHVRRSMRKSIVLVKDIKGTGEEIENVNCEDVVKEPAIKGPVRRSRRKSVVSELHEKEENGLIAEKNMGACEGRSMQKPVMTVKDIKVVGEGIQNAKGKDVENQLVVKQPVRRSLRKSVLPDMLENNSGFLTAEMNAEINVRRSTQKSVLPNTLNEENQVYNQMARNENFQSGKCQDDEKQQKVKEPTRRSRRSVATVSLEEQNNGLHEEKMPKNPIRRSTRKSVALNAVEKVSIDHTEIVVREQDRVGEDGLKLRKHRRSSMEISTSANDSWNTEYFDGQKFRKQQNSQIPNEKDNTGSNHEKPLRTEQASNSTTSKGRSSKRRRTAAPEDVMSVKEANDDMIVREVTEDAHKATHEYNNESSSRVQEICQVNATTEEFSSGPLLVTLTLTDEICTAQGVDEVIPGSESGDNAKEISDKSKQPQEHSDIQAVDSHLSETRNGELDQLSCMAELVPHNCVVSEGKALMSEALVLAKSPDGLSIDFTVGDREEQSLVSGEGRVGLEANASKSGEKNLADVISTGLYAKSLQHDIDGVAEETGKDVMPMDFTIEEHGEKYPVSPVADEKSVSWEASASESSGKALTDILSNDLHTKYLQHDCDVLPKDIGVASGAALRIPESDTNPEIHCNAIAEESIRSADLGKCWSRGRKENPLSTLHPEGVAADGVLPVLNADKGCSSDGRHSSFGPDLLFAEELKESYSRNVENTAVEIDGGNKPSTLVTPGFYVGSDCLEDEDVQPTECDTNKKLAVDQGVTEAEVLAQEKSNDQHVPVKTDLKMKLNGELAGLDMESGCSIAEKKASLVADNLDQQAVTQVQQGDVQEGGSEKPSLCSATLECKHDCGLPEETALPSNKIVGSLPSAEQSPFGLESLFSQESIDESVQYGALASATAHTETGFDESKDCHVKSALENTHVSEPFSHHDTEDISKNDGCMHTPQQDNGMKEANFDEERVLSVFSLDAKQIKEVINSEGVACNGEVSKKLIHSEDLKGSSEKTDVSGPDSSQHGLSDTVPSSAQHAHADDNYDICLGTNTDMLHQGHNDRCSDGTEEQCTSKPWTNDIIEDASAKYIESGVMLLPAEERLNLKNGHLNSKLESTKVQESGLYFNKDIDNILDNGSVIGIIGEMTPSGSSLSKDLSVEYRQEVLDGFSIETSVDGPSTCGEKTVCRVDAVENPSITLAAPDYKHEGASSEEAVRRMKNYAGTCSSNPRELLMELQSLFSKENIKESDPNDGLALPSAENSGYESINVEQRVKVHGSNLSQLGSADPLDEPIGYSKTEVLHLRHNHKDHSNEDKVKQVASEPCTDGFVETAAAAAAKYIERGVVVLPSEERSNLNDGQLNPKLESPNIMESGLNCGKDVCLDNGSVVVVVGKRTPSGSALPEDYPTDHYLQQKPLDGFSVESSLQGTIFGKNIVSSIEGIGNPSLSVASPDYKHEGALSEDEVCRMKNYTGMCSEDPRHLLMELQSLYSEGSTEKSDPQDNLAFPIAKRRRDEPIICHVKKRVDTHISSEPDTYQGPRQDLSRHEKESCMSVPMQAKESGGFLRSGHIKSLFMSAQIDLADDAHLIESQSLYHRDIIAAQEVLCEEKEERKSMPTSNYDILHEKSYSDGHGVDSGICALSEAAPVKVLETGIAVETSSLPDEQLHPELDGDEFEKHSLNWKTDTSWILGTGSVMSKTALLLKGSQTIYCQELGLPNDLSFKFAEEFATCQDESVSISGICQPRSQKHIVEDNFRLSICDAEVLHQDHKEESNEPNEDKSTPKAFENDMSEDAPVEGMGSMLPSISGMSEMPDEQFDTKTSDESEEFSFSCDKDAIENFYTGSAKRDLYPLPKDFRIDSCQKPEVAEVLSLPKCPEESVNNQDESVSGSGHCQQCANESTSTQATYNIEALNQDHEEYNQNNEDQVTSEIPASSVPEAEEIKRSEMAVGLIPAAETSLLPLPDEQLSNELEGNEVDEHNCSSDKGFSSLFDLDLLDREASKLLKDDCMDLSSEDNHSNDRPALRSPKQSTYFQNDNVSGSVEICQSSRQRGIDKLRAKLQNFKVSSTVKGSYIAMSGHRLKSGDSLSQSAITLLRNRENTPAVKAGPPVKPNTDGSVVKDSSRRALQPISGRPRGH